MGRNLGCRGTEKSFSIFSKGSPGILPNMSSKHPAFETSPVWARPQTPCGPHCFPGPTGRWGLGAQSCLCTWQPLTQLTPGPSLTWPSGRRAGSRRQWPAGPGHRPFSAGAQTQEELSS